MNKQYRESWLVEQLVDRRIIYVGTVCRPT